MTEEILHEHSDKPKRILVDQVPYFSQQRNGQEEVGQTTYYIETEDGHFTGTVIFTDNQVTAYSGPANIVVGMSPSSTFKDVLASLKWAVLAIHNARDHEAENAVDDELDTTPAVEETPEEDIVNTDQQQSAVVPTDSSALMGSMNGFKKSGGSNKGFMARLTGMAEEAPQVETAAPVELISGRPTFAAGIKAAKQMQGDLKPLMPTLRASTVAGEANQTLEKLMETMVALTELDEMLENMTEEEWDRLMAGRNAVNEALGIGGGSGSSPKPAAQPGALAESILTRSSGPVDGEDYPIDEDTGLPEGGLASSLIK